PSMVLNDERGTFYCFGCQTSGNIFDFLMLYEHLTFYQALERLAGECNVALRTETDEDRKERSLREQLYDLHTVLTAEFMYQLTENNPYAERALSYLEKRGVHEDMRRKFMIGYAPPDISFVSDFLRKRGFSDEVIYSAGLFSAESKRSYFVDRIVFPVLDLHGRPIAFSARRMNNNDDIPKYINSSGTGLFKKGEVLYGMYQAIGSLRKKNPCVLVEGNFDVVSLHSIGIDNAVAACGTAFTPAHMELVSRYSNRMAVFYDSDDAGRKNTLNVIYCAYERGVRCVVAKLKGFKDASEAIETGERGVAAVRAAVEDKAVNAEDFLFDCFSSARDTGSISFKSDVIGDFWKFHSLLGPVEQYELSRFLAAKLSLPEKMVAEKLSSMSGQMRLNPSERPEAPGFLPERKIEPHDSRTMGIAGEKPLFETDLMKMLAVRRDRFKDEAVSFVRSSDLKNPNSRIIFRILADSDCLAAEDDAFISSISNEEDRRYLSEIIGKYASMYRRYDDARISEMIDSAVKRIVRSRIKDESRNLSALSRIDEADSVLLEKNRMLTALSMLNKSIAEESDGKLAR
ncbi:MAG TPA: DNA primase, partial [Spirochaetaceae bacterium]|nr:DNA primase [Spirochaetaceae bacterium]